MSLRDRIVKDISIKEGVDKRKIDTMINHFCRFTKDVIGRDDYATIMWIHWGKFYVKPSTKKFWDEFRKNVGYEDYRKLTKVQRSIVRSIKDPEARLEQHKTFIKLNEESKRAGQGKRAESQEQGSSM